MVSVIVPWRPGCRHREAAWEYVRGLYAERHPEWEVVETPAPDGPWCKAAAVNPALEASRADLVVVADSDVWCDGLERAVYAVVCGRAQWAMPHRLVNRLSEAGTAALMAGKPYGAKGDFEQRYEGVWGGGIVVAQREVMLSAPLDEKFVGWG